MTRDEKCICVSTLDDHVRLLDRVTGELLNSYSGHINSQLQVGHCITNDDSYVITGSEDGSIFIYDLMETKIVERLDGHERTICGIAYTPQKSEICLLTASADSTIKVWKQYHV
jgi:mitogen-activated protein kinase organizer 1